MEIEKIQNNKKYSKKLLFVVAIFIILIGFFSYRYIQSSKSVTSLEEVSMSLGDFKKMCTDTKGEYKEEIFFGAASYRIIRCGYDKAPDAGRLCKSENQINSCFLCTYRESCGLAAGDFGPIHCNCGSYKMVKKLLSNDIY